jgi:hypothetical protein
MMGRKVFEGGSLDKLVGLIRGSGEEFVFLIHGYEFAFIERTTTEGMAGTIDLFLSPSEKLDLRGSVLVIAGEYDACKE